MKQDASFDSLLASEERFYAFLQPRGLIETHWGRSSSESANSLRFRKFHFPKMKKPSDWSDFPDSVTWALDSEKQFHHRELLESQPTAPPGAMPSDEKSEWDLLCERAGAAIASGAAQKIVPARQLSYALSPDEHKLIRDRLCSRLFFPSMENTYRFLIRSQDSIFFGATPELLFRREGGKIFVPAIAGTRAEVPGVLEGAIREELLASEKDRAEHAWVVEGIRESLRLLGLNPSPPPNPTVLRVSRLYHLFTPIHAANDSRVTGEMLLDALHPTPAIGGHPKAAAANFLFENENWDRGLFSAPLLFRSARSEICLVAIRSALLTPSRIYFFAGAGYVKGSTPESEWEETGKKLQVMQSVLFGENYGRK